MPREFVGRRHELAQLSDLLRKKTASLITIQGRRRLGKSTLISHFCMLNKISISCVQGSRAKTKNFLFYWMRFLGWVQKTQTLQVSLKTFGTDFLVRIPILF
jgi:AAA+ ATPase superfamily predicted ATPase